MASFPRIQQQPGGQMELKNLLLGVLGLNETKPKKD